ncbi:hypothetical protein PG997_015373 [Apiospora hydei]|uniref:Phosphatidylcholine-hydrolyzing phospholipase C n=1 Tax=Apiospora hydei TaxID=1337664 RepID=A0ABR1UQG4_9PEZI
MGDITDVTGPDEASLEARIRESGYLMPPEFPESEKATFAINSFVAPYKPNRSTLSSMEAPHDDLLVTVSGVKLTFGHIVALAGDFYTNREDRKNYFPIADTDQFGRDKGSRSKKTIEQRFDCAVTSLIEDQDGYLKRVQALLDQEHDTVDHALQEDESVARAYHTHATYDNCHIPTDKEFFKAAPTPDLEKMLSFYAWLAYTNIDHFGEDAVTAYSVGHTRALEIARAASKEPSMEKKAEQLRRAYIYEAFAAHYLTDLFSAGHLRSPRRELHTQHNLEMAAAGLLDVPMWDVQNRFMHDDDSATGIMVRNKNGDQWIEYGDKQFFEPQACVNRARSMHCLDLSVQEVYKIGYSSSQVIGSWRDNQNWFAAIKYIPQPMTAVAPQAWLKDWGGYDMHNPAPLWLSPGGGADQEDGWTIRKDLDNHSDFGARVSGSLRNTGSTIGTIWKPAATKECQQIKDARFRADDQFPLQSTIKGLLSGDPSGQAIHYMRKSVWGKSACVLGFSGAEKPDQKCDITMQVTTYASRDLRVSGGGGPVSLDLSKSWAMLPIMSSYPTVLLSDLPSRRCVNMTRFTQGHFIQEPENEYVEQDLIALAQIKGQGVEIGLLSVLDIETPIRHHLDGLSHGAAYGFVKTFRGANSSTDTLLLARAIPKAGHMLVDLVRVRFDQLGNPGMEDSSFQFKCNHIDQPASALVGDVLGRGYDQVVILASDAETAYISVYGSNSKEDVAFSPLGTQKYTLDGDSALTRPILTALVPTSTSNGGLDVLDISRHQSGPSSDVLAGEARPFLPKCKEVTVSDPLASSNAAQYFSIKWMPVRYKPDPDKEAERRGILEIFSWYGVLGARLFGPGKRGWDYDLLGQLPYLGQTSIGAGLGCYGDWGHGFVTWAKEDEWIDMNMFVPSDKNDTTVGSWGMTWDDLDRPHVRGWEVEKRPL